MTDPADSRFRQRYALPAGFRFGARGGHHEPTWNEIDRSRKRMQVYCDGCPAGSHRWLELGGLTSDRAYGTSVSQFLRGSRAEMDFHCPGCGFTWLVPISSLLAAAKSRGNRLLRQRVGDLPGATPTAEPS